ncbi:MAG: helix-turn-helix transcriptional regulator [Ktedonobacteraceae bacterium]
MDGPEDTNLFGELLKRFRERRKFTQSSLAHKIGKQNRGSIQAWESGQYLPSDREIVLKLARTLQLTAGETEELLLAAHHSPQYLTRGAFFSAVEMREHLSLVDIYIDEHGDAPIVDFTLHNSGTQSALPIRIRVEVLDAGEFYYCDEEDRDEDEDDLTRSFLTVSSNYGVKLSPALKGKQVSVKIAHLLRSDEADRFQLRIGQDFLNSRLAYVWYYLKIAILSNTERGGTIEAGPVLLSVPPVDIDSMDVWTSLLTPCAERNRATLRRMSALSANSSASVEATIHRVLGQ